MVTIFWCPAPSGRTLPAANSRPRPAPNANWRSTPSKPRWPRRKPPSPPTHPPEPPLAQAQATLADVLRVRVYLADRADVLAVSQVLRRRLGHNRPANTTLCCALAVEGA